MAGELGEPASLAQTAPPELGLEPSPVRAWLEAWQVHLSQGQIPGWAAEL